MDDEELSELAECLEDACQAAVRRGRCVSQYRLMDNCCPLGALINGNRHLGFPGALRTAEVTGIDFGTALGFMAGFDGATCPPAGESRAFAIGRLFREKYVGADK
jgi:hypothetical protein